MSSNKQVIINQVYAQVSNQSAVQEDQIKSLIEYFKVLNPISDSEEQEIIKELHYKLPVRIDRGAYLKEKNHLPWYDSAKRNIDGKYWERYSQYLLTVKGFETTVIDELDISTDEMMDLLGNPNSKTGFSRKGLIIGDVQSGKTSTYIGLINKAADAGYKVIILLTGTIEKLRKQTQERLDAGFTGIDSKAFINDKQESNIGVGNIDKTISAWSLTSTGNDFNTKVAQQTIGKISSMDVPLLFVLKKNKSVLEKLEQWLRLYNAENGVISAPMILIDDEADNASVNTKKSDDSPTAINKAIRKLLKLFTYENYVAFTATPYANIFINPDTEDEMLNDDLFPKDFIYALTTPSNYIGAESIFGDDATYKYILKNNDDCEKYLPSKHGKEADFDVLPPSLKEAIVSFLIVNAIRDLRGSTNTHRTMLINISRFINVQENIKRVVNGYVKTLQRSIGNYSKMGNDALKNKDIAYIKLIYSKHFERLNEISRTDEDYYSWDEILNQLDESVSSIVVRTVNGGNAPKNLNYDEYEDDGLRIIAVGGYSLSRGLTLEGLCISYFYRNSKMYDTLMQMGRWFGYRPHYADLCQIWMSQESVDWYGYISEATEELKKDVRKMQNAGMTPKDFGLGVRSDKSSLYVTALNKMRSSQEVEMNINLEGQMIETPYISSDSEKNEVNRKLIDDFVLNLEKDGFTLAQNKNGIALATRSGKQFLNVDKDAIVSLLRQIECSPFNFNFSAENLVESINSHKELAVWDVAIAEGEGKKTINIGNLDNIRPVKRAFGLKKHFGQTELQMSGTKSRLGSTNYAYCGLNKKEKEQIESSVRESRPESEKNKSFNQNDYFKISNGIKRNPLLVIYPVQLDWEDDDKELENEKREIAEKMNSICYGFALGIPGTGKNSISYKYRVNLIKYREMLGADDDYEEETGEEND